MIRTYTVQDLESISGLTRRTIGDYVAKGLLAGPSHRGRGARYSQTDVDVLQLIPRLRTLLKNEFPNLTALRAFLRQLSSYDLHSLASKTTEPTFVGAVRMLRVRNAVSALLPQVAPERIAEELRQLTPQQIRSIDAGRLQLGAVLDMQALFSDSDSHAQPYSNGYSVNAEDEWPPEPEFDAEATHPSWSVSWLDGLSSSGGANGVSPVSAETVLNGTDADTANPAQPPEMQTKMASGEADGDKPADDEPPDAERLADIAKRVERLERLLVTE